MSSIQVFWRDGLTSHAHRPVEIAPISGSLPLAARRDQVVRAVAAAFGISDYSVEYRAEALPGTHTAGPTVWVIKPDHAVRDGVGVTVFLFPDGEGRPLSFGVEPR